MQSYHLSDSTPVYITKLLGKKSCVKAASINQSQEILHHPQ